jgi:hypothetical protein
LVTGGNNSGIEDDDDDDEMTMRRAHREIFAARAKAAQRSFNHRD